MKNANYVSYKFARIPTGTTIALKHDKEYKRTKVKNYLEHSEIRKSGFAIFLDQDTEKCILFEILLKPLQLYNLLF